MNIANDKVVSLDFKMIDSDGKVVDSSEHEPLIYLHGHENIPQGLEEHLTGKSIGDSFKITLAPAQAFGEIDESLIDTVSRSEFDPGKIEIGDTFQTFDDNGNPRIVVVSEFDDEKFVLNGNHPLAGQSFTFEGTVSEIRDATEDEISHGHIHSGGCGHDHGHDHDHDGCSHH